MGLAAVSGWSQIARPLANNREDRTRQRPESARPSQYFGGFFETHSSCFVALNPKVELNHIPSSSQ